MNKERESQIEPFEFRLPKKNRLERGQVVKGTVVSIGSSNIFIDVGTKSEASLDLKEVTEPDGSIKVKVGDLVDAYVVETEPEIILSFALARAHLNRELLEDAYDLGIPVEGKVTGVNKGGFEVDFNGVRAFCPISQIDMGYCTDASIYLNQTFQFRVTEYAEDGRNMVVSRRVLLEEEKQEAAAATEALLHEGAEFEGVVVSLQPYGAFVDIGGIQGMVHVSEITHSHIEHAQEALQVGQKVRVRVMRVERDAKKQKDRLRVALSIRALLGDPWEQTVAKLSEGTTVEGKVVRLQPFGAFVEIAPGVDGLIHISEISDQRIKSPGDLLAIGQIVKASVLKIDTAARRISLSLRGQDSPGIEMMSVGDVVDVVVDKLKPFGLLVRVKGGARNVRGLIPAEETGTGQGANLRRTFPEGTELKAMVTAIEPDTGKIRFSLKAVTEQIEQEDYSKFLGNGSEKAQTPTKKEERNMGSFGELLMKSLNKEKDIKSQPKK